MTVSQHSVRLVDRDEYKQFAKGNFIFAGIIELYVQYHDSYVSLCYLLKWKCLWCYILSVYIHTGKAEICLAHGRVLRGGAGRCAPPRG